jgi:hypothetical protein
MLQEGCRASLVRVARNSGRESPETSRLVGTNFRGRRFTGLIDPNAKEPRFRFGVVWPWLRFARPVWFWR